MRTLPIAQVKAHLAELADRVEKQQDLITVTRNGRPSFHMISTDELEGLHETIAILSDTDLVSSLIVANDEAESGQGIPLNRDEVLARLATDAQD